MDGPATGGETARHPFRNRHGVPGTFTEYRARRLPLRLPTRTFRPPIDVEKPDRLTVKLIGPAFFVLDSRNASSPLPMKIERPPDSRR